FVLRYALMLRVSRQHQQFAFMHVRRRLLYCGDQPSVYRLSLDRGSAVCVFACGATLSCAMRSCFAFLVGISNAAVRNTALGSCASMASLVLPAGLTATGLPIGMEFAGLSGMDREILALGLSLEKVLGPVPAPKI